jgi:hypothetical protein
MRSWNRLSFALGAATVASFFGTAAITGSVIVGTWVSAMLYFAALAASAKAKGRSFAWALLGMLPVLGWIPLARLRDHAAASGDTTVATRRLGAGAGLRAGFVSLLGGTLCTLCMLPQLLFWEARPHARQLVSLLEVHHETHGGYPASIEPLAAAQDPRIPLGSIRYETHDEGRAFLLTVNNWDERETYDSRTGSWTFERL